MTCERRLQEAGTYHVIAISGGNIAILAGLLIVLLRVCRAGPRTSALLVILMLTAYASVVEGGSSVGRATLMAAIYFAAQVCDHRSLPRQRGCADGGDSVLRVPLQVVDAGFALTFGATLGILVGMSRLSGVFPSSQWLRRAGRRCLVASVCAEIALLADRRVRVFARHARRPHRQLRGDSADDRRADCGDGRRALDCRVRRSRALWAGWIAHVAVEGLIGSAALVDIFPWLTRRLAPPSPWVIAAYYASLIAVASTAFSRLALAALIVAGFWIVATPTLPTTAKRLQVTFLDVGQGDAAVVQFPDGRTLSIDAGGLAATTFDIGSRVVSPAFWALGVRRLDYMSITHGDVDHIGGAASVFRDFRPFEVWEGVPVPPHRPTRELRALGGRDRAPCGERCSPTIDVSFGDVDLIVHHPPRPDWERQRVRNDDSEVIEILYGGVSFVFTGDIGRDVERAIASDSHESRFEFSRCLTTAARHRARRYFLDALRPDIAVISAGRGNPFGHPVPSVLERYRNVGAAIYRTDLDGAVTVETDGTTVRVKTFTGRRLTLRTNGR